jgi:hypothetical protein
MSGFELQTEGYARACLQLWHRRGRDENGFAESSILCLRRRFRFSVLQHHVLPRHTPHYHMHIVFSGSLQIPPSYSGGQSVCFCVLSRRCTERNTIFAGSRQHKSIVLAFFQSCALVRVYFIFGKRSKEGASTSNRRGKRSVDKFRVTQTGRLSPLCRILTHRTRKLIDC